MLLKEMKNFVKKIAKIFQKNLVVKK